MTIPELFQEIGVWFESVWSFVFPKVIWFADTIGSQIDNREIATLILLAFLLLFALIKTQGSIIKSFLDVARCALKPQLSIPAILLIAYSIGLIYIAHLLNWWSSDLLLDTIIEIAFVGIPSLAISAKANSIKSIVRKFIFPEICFGAFAAYYIGIKSFSIPVELILQIVIFIFAMGKIVWEREPDGGLAVKISDGLLAIIGIAVFSAMTVQLIADWDTYDWLTELQTVLMSIWYPIFMLPFVIILGYYAALETLIIRINVNEKTLDFLKKIFLVFELMPSLRMATHFGGYEASQYAECDTWKARRRFCKDYKAELKKKAEVENQKLKRMETGKGKRGYDENGLWLDWEDLEKIKVALWTVVSVQNRNWNEKGEYEFNMQSQIVDMFIPRGCSGESFVSDDHKLYACWMSNKTGFTFGMAAYDGLFPPMRFEGENKPIIDSEKPLANFVSDEEEDLLPNWFASFHTDSSYS